MMNTKGKKRIMKALLLIVSAAMWAAGCSAGGSSGGSSSSAQVASDRVMEMGASGGASPAAVTDQYGNANSASPSSGGVRGESGAAEAPAAPAAGGTFSGTAEGRMLIYTANVTMEVESYADAYTEIQNLIHLSGGYLANFSEQTNDKERSARFTIKVPAQGFDGFMQRLEQIPNTKLNRSMSAQDVTEEFVDLEARLSAKQVVEARYIEYMEKASRAEDLIRYTNELAAIQEEIERLKGRMRYLQANVDYSTIELRVYEKQTSVIAAGGGSLGVRMAEALRNSLNALAATAEAVMVVAAGALPIVAALAVIGLPIYWFGFRGRKRGWKGEPGNPGNPGEPPNA